MEIFFIALGSVAILFLAALPGYLLINRKMISEDCIPGFSKVLLFVCQPCLCVYTFTSSEFSPKKLLNVGIFALLCVIINVIMLGGAYLILRRKYKNPIYRIMTIASAFSNSAFFGIPIIEAIMKDSASELIIYTTVFALVMNVVGWTLGSAIISGDTKYISVKKIFLNPAIIGAAIALILFIFEIPLGDNLGSMVTITARMSTPLSMLIMGMRLATVKFSKLFNDLNVYISIAINQLIMPLIAFIIICFLPISYEIRAAFFIISACPVASVVLNFSEIVGEGQKEAANTVLLGTMFSILTLPIMMLLLPLIN